MPEAGRKKISRQAATWRDPAGKVIKTTDASTMCWSPRLPRHLRAVNPETGHRQPLRCKTCPGCLELDRRRLEKRMVERYCDYPGQLFLAEIAAPLEDHARLSHQLHRRRGLELERGYWRLNPGRFAVVARSRDQIDRVLDKLKLPHELYTVRKNGRRRSWNRLSRGLLVARQHYGKQRNRWYARGLPPARTLSWTIEKIPREEREPFDWRSSPRARSDNLVLVPPEIWQDCPRRNRKSLWALMQTPATPEMAKAIAEAVHSTAAKLSLTAAPSGASGVSAVQRRLEEEQKRRQVIEDAARAASANISPISLGESHASSVHHDSSEKRELLSNEDLARAGPRGLPVWQERDVCEQGRYSQARDEARAKYHRENLEIFAAFAKRGQAPASSSSEASTSKPARIPPG